MYIKSFSITNYRNIIEKQTIIFDKYLTILVGKNNEGKTNILQALNTLFYVIKNFKFNPFLPHRKSINIFSIERDLPERNKKTFSTFDILFDNNIRISLEIGFLNHNQITLNSFSFFNSGIGSSNLEIRIDNKLITDFKKQEIILSKIYNEIKYQYIPTVRNDLLANELINNIISLELKKLRAKEQKKLKHALKQIEKLQKPIIKKIETNVKKIVNIFIPNIKNVSLKKEDNNYYMNSRLLSSNFYKIKINDGTYNTDLEQKGEGLKNLFCIGMVGQKTKEKIGNGLIFAIEEPEAHLHPTAIRQLNDVIYNISKKNQVILTTHSPLFVNSDNISANIIVDKGKVRQVKNIRDIRKELGVQISDNLIHSKYIIFVEGETDKMILSKIISEKSKKLKNLLSSQLLSFYVINGVGNLNTNINFFKTMIISKFCCILDFDKTAKESVKKSIENSSISEKEVFYYRVKGKKECELEDLINPEIYKKHLKETYSVNFEKTKKKDIWNKRLRQAFENASKNLTEETKQTIKIYIANEVEKIGVKSLINKGNSINGLIKSLENYFE